ncbi:MAG: AzlD domain-containing protein [Candidatus Hodarchaeales archaeon]|jgi:branched-subunit amino acid transport protein
MTDLGVYIPVFVIIGLATFLMRAIFLYILPEIMKSKILRKGLKSVSNSLLIALVIPFTFFVDGVFSPWRVEVLVLGIVIPIIWYSRKPGFSLIFAIGIFMGINILIP